MAVQMNEKYKPLFTPWKIGNVEIKNRIVLCPMGGTSLFGWMESNHFDKEAAEFFIERAQNNVGLIIPGIAPLRDPMFGKWLYKNKKMFADLKTFMEEIHKTGAKLFVQLTAGFGRSFAITQGLVPIVKNKFLSTLVKPIINIDRLTASPSELPSRWLDGYTTRAITKKEIDEMVFAFAETSRLCKEAGVDGVEVHAVHEGYLIDQFTTAYTNKRTDEYGGSFENRYRFAVDIVKAIKDKCGKEYPVSLRYSVVSKTKDFGKGALPTEKKYTEIGRDINESERAAKYLQEAGYDMLNADNGTYDAWYWAHPPIYMPENCNLNDVSHIKSFVDIPVVCAGRMDPVTAANAIAKNKIDAMGVARQFLVDPEWVTKLMTGREKEIQPCICCHNGCFNLAHYKGVANDQSLNDAKHMARCALNPQTMQGHKYDVVVVPEEKKKRVAIIGGGIGGMEVARICAIRGHDVMLYEQTDKLGGAYIAASAPSFKNKDKELLEWYITQLKRLPNVHIRFKTRILDVNNVQADVVVVATGALPKRLKVSGLENAVDACDYLTGEATVGKDVLIVGGGLTGCEIAYDLFFKGKRPIIVEAQDDLMAVKGLCMANTSYLKDFFELNKVEVHLQSTLQEYKPNGVCVIKDKDGNLTELDVDNVILAIGYTPNPIANEDNNVYLVGDCKEVGNLKTVIWRAWEVACKI